jgi:hypothetical protein
MDNRSFQNIFHIFNTQSMIFKHWLAILEASINWRNEEAGSYFTE